MSENFNFRTEILSKYDEQIHQLFQESFDCLPIAGLIDNKILALHGGLSPEMTNISAINKLNRFCEIPNKGLFTDMMWSDPVDNDTGF